ncbi:Putative sugar-binding N-terminal domain-containing protein [Thermanaeromonas toyohensis ToBE]|uniref:Putative sugar-binding N-terminal domain-containing protein n=1 Tax=Thermanaeromonas toyohensis ToBE TaxID=698762 RepID=A0A1W1V9E3_9FIRM|nr:four-carbon acid sugar kinase family protein [Thermanaeromonas toyohensis]SMB89681.1 Putative sugar-binding N-terminal domain-containing protein [Thermanaeromonas toyohensis ToBE]
MAKWAVVADDLTGANATGVLFAKKGLKIVTVINYRMLPELLTVNWEGLVVNTFSRGVVPAEARRRVEETVSILRQAGVSYFGKRIDSTARGNLGAEIEGMLATLGPEYIAVVVENDFSGPRVCPASFTKAGVLYTRWLGKKISSYPKGKRNRMEKGIYNNKYIPG